MSTVSLSFDRERVAQEQSELLGAGLSPVLATAYAESAEFSRQLARVHGRLDAIRERLHEPHPLVRKPAMRSEPAPQFVYFIADEDEQLVKIGVSSDPQARLASLQTGSPSRLRLIGTLPGDQALETRLHRRFHYLRRHGEWFKLSQEIKGLITAKPRG